MDGSPVCGVTLGHDRGKWIPDFGRDHAQRARDRDRSSIRMTIRCTRSALLPARYAMRTAIAWRPARPCRSPALLAHELRDRGRDRDRGQGRRRHPRLVSHRPGSVPDRAARRPAGRGALPACPCAADLRRIAAAAARPGRFLRGGRQLSSSPMPGAAAAGRPMRASPRSGRARPKRARSLISRRKPNTATSRRATPASSGC
jgi:hypothetical protein